MLNFLIFSKDRACQLEMLIRSIKEYISLPGPHLSYRITVLYKETEEYKLSYDLLRSKNSADAVKFVRESKFNVDFLQLLGISKYTCLLTDDSLFFQKVRNFVWPQEDECFSFRLGYNTLIQDHTVPTLQPPLIPDSMFNDVVSWNPAKYPNNCNFGYPYSIDGHVYTSTNLLKILSGKEFVSTNEMEGILNNSRSDISRIYSFTHSRLVNIPCNNISGLTKAGVFHGYSMKELDSLFMSGKVLKIKDGTPIVGCHQEVEFEVMNGIQGL